MREIKFRFRCKETGIEIGTKTEGLTIYPENFQIYSGGLNVTDRYIVEQFTGLHDKNGKEIYEGDILRIFYHNRDEPATGRMVYNTELIRFEAIDDIPDNEERCWDSVEVIGNVYETAHQPKPND